MKEDRLGPLYDVKDYDRGIHMLVGSNQHRGPQRVRGWLPSLVHYCFLDDLRTERVVAEPNNLNRKMITVGTPPHPSPLLPLFFPLLLDVGSGDRADQVLGSISSRLDL